MVMGGPGREAPACSPESSCCRAVRAARARPTRGQAGEAATAPCLPWGGVQSKRRPPPGLWGPLAEDPSGAPGGRGRSPPSHAPPAHPRLGARPALRATPAARPAPPSRPPDQRRPRPQPQGQDAHPEAELALACPLPPSARQHFRDAPEGAERRCLEAARAAKIPPPPREGRAGAGGVMEDSEADASELQRLVAVEEQRARFTSQVPRGGGGAQPPASPPPASGREFRRLSRRRV